jgi:sulfite reductase (ferredoxin)
MSNGVKASHPRIASEIAYIPACDLLAAAKAVVGIHRDFGNRENRKIARLKYVLDNKGVDWFRDELNGRMGRVLEPPKELAWNRHADYLGWHPQHDGRLFFGLRVVNGRVQGPIRDAIREIITAYRPGIRFTVQQNLIFTDVDPSQRDGIEAILRKHAVALPHELPPVLRHSMACPALPTCGQAITESERMAPDLISRIQAELDAAGVAPEVIHLRSTGCPNGCARPYTAEIGIVGQSVNLYSIYLGGSPLATRLAKLYSHNIKLENIASTLRPFFDEWKIERSAAEAFGDFWNRKHGANYKEAGVHG